MDRPEVARPVDHAVVPDALDDRPLGAADPVDLHLHTLASDGFWTPEALIGHLAERGFRVAAVCDHDTQRSVAEAMRRGAERGVRVVPGVEVTTRWADRQWHLLVYGIAPDREDEAAAPFRAVLAELDAELQRLAADARARLEGSGRALPSLPELAAGRPMWPFHVLSAAIKEGHVKNLKEAAELVTSLGGGFSADQPLARVVDAAHRAGGLCLVAHPGRSDSVGVMTEADLDAMLAEVPIDGLEAHYRSYSDAQTALYRDLAARRGLLVSCGSDSHAPNMPVDPRPWRAAWCAELLARLGIAVEAPAEEPVWAPGMDPLAVVPPPPGAPEQPAADGQPDPPGEQLKDAAAELEQPAEATAP
jgi:3',5'-nucleoside bisphosphate phosphatase